MSESITTKDIEWDTKQATAVTERPVMAVENGVYTLNSINEQMTYAKFLIDNGLVSETFKKPSQLIVAIQFCKDLGLSNSALSNFYVVSGKAAIFGDTLIGLVMGSGLVADKKIEWFDEQGETIVRPKKGIKEFGCEVSYLRKGFASYVTATYTYDDRELSRSSNPVWLKFAKDMLWRRSDIRCLKALFPDAMRGIEVVEYLEDSNIKLDDKEKAKLATSIFSNED